LSDHHHHTHGPDEPSHLSEIDVRVRALETLLTRKGYVDPAALDRIIEIYETEVGHKKGVRAVAFQRVSSSAAISDFE
jgi:nitrile hydratase subunit alpha